jgi:hypothetical protein
VENFVLTKHNMPDLNEQLEKAIREVPEFDKSKNNIDMTVTNEGLRIDLMVQNDVRPDQVTQVRGFADQHLRKADHPLDPANRRISLIVQYQDKKPVAEGLAEGQGEDGKANAGEGKEADRKSTEGAAAKPEVESKKPVENSHKE